MLGECHPPPPVAGVDEHSTYLIAYGDHVTRVGEHPLHTLAGFVGARLAPEISGVHTLPIHPSTGDGGFSVVDHALVDPELGTWGDISALARSTSWMADAVVNHVSASSPWVTEYLAGDPGRAGFFRQLPAGTDTSMVVRPRTSPLGHEFLRDDGSTVRLWTTFSADQVDLDFATPEVLVTVAAVVARFVGAGAAAVRLDAIAFAWKDPGRTSMSLPETHAVVAFLRACLDEVAPWCLLVTETNVPETENVAYFGTERYPEAHMVYRFALPPLVLHTILTGDSTTLVGWMRSLDPAPGGATFANILSTHDGIGLRGAEGLLDHGQLAMLAEAAERCGGVVNFRATPGGPVPYELCTTWYSILADGHSADDALARHLASHAIAFALQGVPFIYLGALAAATNDDRRFAASGHGRDLNRTKFDAEQLTAAIDEPLSRQARSLAGLRRLLAARASSPAFAPHSAQIIHPTPTDAVIVERRAPTGERALVVVNVTSHETAVDLPGGDIIELAPWGVDFVFH